jgi:hypothetical protein
MGTDQFFPSGYGYGFVCPLGTLPTAIPSWIVGVWLGLEIGITLHPIELRPLIGSEGYDRISNN